MTNTPKYDRLTNAIAKVMIDYGYDPHLEVNDMRDNDDLQAINKGITVYWWADIIESMKRIKNNEQN